MRFFVSGFGAEKLVAIFQLLLWAHRKNIYILLWAAFDNVWVGEHGPSAGSIEVGAFRRCGRAQIRS